ncbi:hypothetical protein K7432_000803 [Basidiobolus ranarum]|uniref:Uncharacterized protein n=1 Tax=Basidiobolus ranarum TaxID=34480 RepID=A0ABR2WAK7_9FUNG
MDEDYKQCVKKSSFLKKLLRVARSPQVSRSKRHSQIPTEPELLLNIIPVPSVLTRSMSDSCVMSSAPLPSPSNPHTHQRSLTSVSGVRISFDDLLESDNSEYTIRMSLTPALIREHENRNILSH